jgi:hypothetical protein
MNKIPSLISPRNKYNAWKFSPICIVFSETPFSYCYGSVTYMYMKAVNHISLPSSPPFTLPFPKVPPIHTISIL